MTTYLVAGGAYFAIVGFAPLIAVGIAEWRENSRTRQFVAFMHRAWGE